MGIGMRPHGIWSWHGYGQLWPVMDPFGSFWQVMVMACHGMDVTGSTISCIQGSTPRCGRPLRHSAPHFDPRSPRPWRHDLAGAAHQGQQGSPWQRPRQLFDIEDIDDIDDIDIWLGNTEIPGTNWNNLKLILRIPLRSQDPSHIPSQPRASTYGLRRLDLKATSHPGETEEQRHGPGATWRNAQPWPCFLHTIAYRLSRTSAFQLPTMFLIVFALSKCVSIFFLDTYWNSVLSYWNSVLQKSFGDR